MKGTMASPRQPPSKTVPDLRLFCPSEWDIPEEESPQCPNGTMSYQTPESSNSEWEVASEGNFRRVSESSSSEWLCVSMRTERWWLGVGWLKISPGTLDGVPALF